MTVSLFAIYKVPEDKAGFDDHYFKTHAPLAQQMPGLVEMRLNRVTGMPMKPPGEADLYLIAELVFETQSDLMSALGSDEGKAAAKDVMGFAGTLVKMYFTQTADQPVAV